MKTLNKTAAKTLQSLLSQLVDGHAKIDNAPGTYTALSVERIGGNLVSIAHYGEQNGDLMADPEMVIWIAGDAFVPVSYRNDYVGVNQESVLFENGQPSRLAPRLQADHASFANTWLKNIRYQQAVR